MRRHTDKQAYRYKHTHIHMHNTDTNAHTQTQTHKRTPCIHHIYITIVPGLLGTLNKTPRKAGSALGKRQ